MQIASLRFWTRVASLTFIGNNRYTTTASNNPDQKMYGMEKISVNKKTYWIFIVIQLS